MIDYSLWVLLKPTWTETYVSETAGNVVHASVILNIVPRKTIERSSYQIEITLYISTTKSVLSQKVYRLIQKKHTVAPVVTIFV